MADYMRQNRELWDELARVHSQPSAYYDVERFRAGELSLRSIEREEVGDVRGKSLLHLQCHFGLDTLSWARLGARVTGLDFSEAAIARARELATESGLDARFLCADINDLASGIGETFDIVFTSYGTIVWLPDLDRWASLISRSLCDGGMFYIVDGHPFSMALSNEDDPAVLKVAGPYFHAPEPTEMPPDHDYAVPGASPSLPSYEWSHSLGEIVTALAGAGLRIVFLHEFPYCDGAYLKNMRQDAGGWWWMADENIRIPHSFSIKAVRCR
jgi:SAM-dependent methyltransferase